MKTILPLIAVCTFVHQASFTQVNSSSSKIQLPKVMPWLLTGNKGTDTSVNFIGTKDAVPLSFKVNNNRAGFIDLKSTGNTVFGYQSLNINTYGYWNTAVGYQTLYLNTTGEGNTANGYQALYNNDWGGVNTATGYQALYSNVYGNWNTATGAKALQSNGSGDGNTATGYQSLYSNIYGGNNTANGYNALYSNTGGHYNTAAGSFALSNNTTGSFNTAYGNQALSNNTDGTDNIAIGPFALYYNSTGSENIANGYEALYSNTTGTHNTSNGNYSLYFNTTGNYNTANGTYALNYNSEGTHNTADGYSAISKNTSGIGNTAIGAFSFSNNTTGSFNTGLGLGTDIPYQSEISNATAIGTAAIVDASDKVRIGNESVTSIGGQVGWSNYSDERIKNNVQENVPGLVFIQKLRPITYHFNVHKQNELLQKKDSLQWRTKNDIEKVQFTGLIAQEVDKAAKKLNYDFSGVDKSGKVWSLRYGDFIAPIIKALQELNDSLIEVTGKQQQQIQTLQARIDRIEAMLSVNQNALSYNRASVEQNVPNPYSGVTTIGYYLPTKYNSAYINFYSSTGFLIKSTQINRGGKGTVTLKDQLPAGIYQYSLIVDGKVMDSKRMVQTK